MTRSLEELLADYREDAAVLARRGRKCEAELMRRVADEMADAAEDHLRWLTEAHAMLRSGRPQAWFRRRRAEWYAVGHARVDSRGRWRYRQAVVPRRGNPSAAYEQGLSGREEL